MAVQVVLIDHVCIVSLIYIYIVIGCVFQSSTDGVLCDFKECFDCVEKLMGNYLLYLEFDGLCDIKSIKSYDILQDFGSVYS